jgi:hypothetical protein
MNRIQHPSFFMSILLTHAVCGQNLAELVEGKAVQNEDRVVCEAGNLIPQDVVPVNQPKVSAPLPDIHFFEGFASDSSEKVLLDHVEKMFANDPDHACEIVKEAITVAQAEVELVAKIVETACLAAPEKMRIIAQCAIAACPDALPLIQRVLAKLDPATGLTADGKSGLEKGGVEETADMDPPLVPPNIPPLGNPPIPIDTPPPSPPPFPPTISPPPSTNNNR